MLVCLMPLNLSAGENEDHPSQEYYDNKEQMSLRDCKKEVKSFNKDVSAGDFIKVGVVLSPKACDVVYLGDLAESNEEAIQYINEIYEANESPLQLDEKLDNIYHVQWPKP